MEEDFQQQGKRPSRGWYLLPIFFGIIGGIAGYFLVRDDDKKFGKRLIIIGIIVTVVWPVIIFVPAALYSMGVFTLPGGGLSKCSPCFSGGSTITYIDHSADILVLRVGSSEISNTKVTVGTTSVSGSPATNLPGTDITFTSTGLFVGDVDIVVEYTLTSSGFTHSTTATLH